MSVLPQRMKKVSIVSVLAVVVVVVLLVLWERTRGMTQTRTDYLTTVRLSGTTGASVHGQYVRDGKSVTFSGVLPWSLSESNLTRFEVRKAKPEVLLSVDARGGESTISAHAAPGTKGMRIDMEGGWSVETLK